MDLSIILMGVAIIALIAASLYQRKVQKRSEQVYQDALDALKMALKRNTDEEEVLRLIKIFRNSGFPPTINSKCVSCKEQKERNLLYFQAAMKIKNYDHQVFTDGDYEHIKSEISKFIPRQRLNRDFGEKNKIIDDVLPLALMLSENIDYMTEEVFGTGYLQHS